jgi:hypothetical protein
MSLINDALKRARETQQNHRSPGAPPLSPVESPAHGGAHWILAASAILFLAAASVVLGPALFGHKVPPAVAANAPNIPTPPPVAAASAPAASSPPPVANTNPPTVANASPVAAATTNPPPAAVAVERSPKVQGIIFNSTQPLAIVSGQTVNVGDRVGDFQVTQITQSKVVFQCPDGTQKTLGIGD